MISVLAPRSFQSGITVESAQYQLLHIDDDRSLFPKVLSIIMPIIGTTAVVLRFWSQRLIKARLHWDDYTMLASLVLMFGLWTIFILMYWYFRVGKHEITVSPSMGESGLLMLYIGQVLYCFTYSLIKISILLLYHRLFVLPWFRLCTKICLGFVICFIVGGTAASIFTCNPIDGFWKIINLVTDLIILVLPMPVIWSLKVPRRQKYVLCAIFVLGSGVLIATIFRIVALREVDDSDLTWTLNHHMIWTMIEVTFGIVCACLPTMRPILRGLKKTISWPGTLSWPGRSSVMSRSPRFYTSAGRWVSSSKLISNPSAASHPPHESQGGKGESMGMWTVSVNSTDDVERGTVSPKQGEHEEVKE